jgi:hypothetical protein
MEKCGATVGGACEQPATWRQDVHAGAGDRGRFIYHAYWCDEHAGRITEKRRIEWGAPPKMVQLVARGCE